MQHNPKSKNPTSANQRADSKIQGVGRLTIKAVLAMTDIVESVHQRIKAQSTASEKERRSGISGLVYRNIRHLTSLLGKQIDEPLATISQTLASQPDSASSNALLAALNGVLGDHLVLSESPLAIRMQFRKDGHTLTDCQLQEIINHSHGKLLIMVHGLCMNDLQWCREGHDHGAELAKDLNLGAIYLHYNTGLHISENGKQFSALLGSLISLTHKPLSINILAHSMGGLVSRSAFQAAGSSGHKWPEFINKLIFLGTPHHGAVLEQAGNWLDLILGKHSYTEPFSRIVKVRSAGITDLRYGNVQKSDWDKGDRFEYSDDQRSPLPLPNKVQCFAIATSATHSPKGLLGDGLVTIKSALGQHENPLFDLQFSQKRSWIGTNIHHMQLLSDLKVYHIVKHWLVHN